MIVDSLENWKDYSLGEAWKRAFEFLEGLGADAEEREYAIDGGAVFARVMSYPTKRETDPTAVLESHRKYVDIQMALVGSERIGVYATSSLTEKVAYDPEKDASFYRYEEAAKLQLSMYPGVFACLLPQDAHMPQLFTEDEGAVVKKVVVKILRDRLEL